MNYMMWHLYKSSKGHYIECTHHYQANILSYTKYIQLEKCMLYIQLGKLCKSMLCYLDNIQLDR